MPSPNWTAVKKCTIILPGLLSSNATTNTPSGSTPTAAPTMGNATLPDDYGVSPPSAAPTVAQERFRRI